MDQPFFAFYAYIQIYKSCNEQYRDMSLDNKFSYLVAITRFFCGYLSFLDGILNILLHPGIIIWMLQFATVFWKHFTDRQPHKMWYEILQIILNKIGAEL